MNKNLVASLIFFLTISPFLSEASSGNALDLLLKSTSISERRAAYFDILKNPDAHSDQIVLGLDNWQKTGGLGTEVLNRLIYLASVLKRNEFIKPLANIASDPEYQEHQCIYWCPAHFALAVYNVSRPWVSPGQATNWNIPYIPNDGLLRGLSLSRSSPGIEFARFEDQESLSKAETLSEAELIQQASPSNMNLTTRWIAAAVLACTVADDKNLEELYWLAIEEIGRDDIEYRHSIYRAILRAEKARAEKTK